MGKGAYLGGSTVIRPEMKWGDCSAAPRKRKLGRVKKRFLIYVIKSELQGCAVKSIPESFPIITNLIRESGGIKEWAESQSEYKQTRSSMQKKYDKSNPNGPKTQNAHLLSSIPEIEARIKANQEIIDKIQTQIEQDEHLIKSIIASCAESYK